MAAKSYDKLLKLLLIGDSGVGKTCLLHRYVEDTFSPSFISTIGIDFKMKTLDLDGKKIKLQIWDTAGQERFHTITASYYRGAKGIMLVYDVTNRKTFENIGRWIGNINSFASLDVEKIMIANKCDMEDRRVVLHEEVVSLANEHKVNFFETSAKTGQNVNEAFVEFARDVLKKEDSRDSDRTAVTLGPRITETSDGVTNCEKC